LSLYIFVVPTGGDEATERPAITRSPLAGWMGWPGPDPIRLIKDALHLWSILLDFDIPANPDPIERLIRWNRFQTSDMRGVAMSEQLTAELQQLRNRNSERLNEPHRAPLGPSDGVAIVNLLARMATELELLEGKPDGVLAW